MEFVRPLSILVLIAVIPTGAAADPLLSPETRRAAGQLRDRIVAGSRASEWVREITDLAGPRLAGSPGDRAAVAAALALLRAEGFANVRAEKVTVHVWQRGVETGEVIAPASQSLALTALGGSVATPEGGLEGEVLRVASLEELDAKGEACRGKIVFIDRPMARTSDGSGYGAAAGIRSAGPSRAAKLGAIGLLIRSLGTDHNRLPHTGSLRYEPEIAKIPAAAVSVPDADLLTRLSARGGPVRVRFTLSCRTLPDAESANVVGEVPGSQTPGEIVLLGAHLDSWDLGTGAIDDAAGCGIVIEAARQIAALTARPRRTIRVVLFANEENGIAGGKAYVKDHAAELDRHAAALEADMGQGPPLGFSWTAGPSGEALVKEIAALLAPIAADHLTQGSFGGVDLMNLLPSGIPQLGLSLDATTYFDLHHTANDTFDKIDPRTLDRSAAAAAVAAYVLAAIPQRLEPIPADKREIPK